MPDLLINPRATIDSTNLNRGLGLALQFTKRTPAQACNRAGLEVSVTAKNNMPMVTVQTIDEQLNAEKEVMLGKRGQPTKKRRFVSKPGTATGSNSSVPLAVLIIQARANKDSRYNELTNSAYFQASPFKGVSRAAGLAAMAAEVSKMIWRRHSSIAFLKAGWVDVIKLLMQLVKGGRPVGAMSDSKIARTPDLGRATPANDGDVNATCTIENDIGYRGKNAASFNRALIEHGAPGLQAALDGEGRKQMQYFLDKTGKEDLEIPVNKAWS